MFLYKLQSEDYPQETYVDMVQLSYNRRYLHPHPQQHPPLSLFDIKLLKSPYTFY